MWGVGITQYHGLDTSRAIGRGTGASVTGNTPNGDLHGQNPFNNIQYERLFMFGCLTFKRLAQDVRGRTRLLSPQHIQAFFTIHRHNGRM